MEGVGVKDLCKGLKFHISSGVIPNIQVNIKDKGGFWDFIEGFQKE